MLKTKLFDGYMPDVRPVLNSTHTVTVSLALSLQQIVHLVRTEGYTPVYIIIYHALLTYSLLYY